MLSTVQAHEAVLLPTSARLLCPLPKVKPTAETVKRACQRGDLQITEWLRINASGMLWLEQRRIKKDAAAHRYPYIAMANQFSRWDETGREQVVEATDSSGQPVYVTIPVPQASVFEQPGSYPSDDGPLYRGDRVRLLDSMPRWIRVSWEKDSATVDRWIWTPQAFSLAAQLDHAMETAEMRLVSSGSGSDSEAVAALETLAGLFPVQLTHNGEAALSLVHPELHLMLSDTLGWHISTQSLKKVEPLAIQPGETVAFEPDPATLKCAVPADLSPGGYIVRVVLTSPELDMPVYSGEHTFRHGLADTRNDSCDSSS